MTLPLYCAFLLAAMSLLVIPGPTVLLIIGYGLADGRKSSWPVVVGVALGDAVACTGSVIGLGAVLAASATAFTIVKLVGAAYVVYLGIGMIRSGSAGSPAVPTSSPRRKFTHAFAVTASNPKDILFFLAFLPQFVNPTQPANPQLALLGATFVILSAVNATAYSYLSGSAGNRIRNPRFLRRLRAFGGSILVGAGVLTAASGQ